MNGFAKQVYVCVLTPSSQNFHMKRFCIFSAVLTCASLSIGCDPLLISCCDGYIYYDETAHPDDAFKQMCLNAMTCDQKYDLNFDCKLREVDKYVDAAIACCAPLKDEIRTSILNDAVSSPEDWTAADTQLFLPLLDEIFTRRDGEHYISAQINSYNPYDNAKYGGNNIYESLTDESANKYNYNLPMNAYTWCLLNTNPQTYKCDLYGAKEFERSLQACCTGNDTSCLTTYIKNSGNCNDVAQGE